MKPEHKDEMKARARNICLKIAYDGTNYHGFQRQTPPILAVQNVLEEKLAVLFGDTIELAAAGRTDAGVHARGQVVNFFTNGTIPTERIAYASVNLLPRDITILAAWEGARDFSARHSATAKTYTYTVQTGKTPNPFTRDHAWYVRRPLDLEKMNAALKRLLGEHDFSSFRASGGAPMSPIRTLYRADAEQKDGLIQFTFHGNGFLYHMVRNIVGTAIAVGLGECSLERFQKILASRDRRTAAATAPPEGLCLESVEYGDYSVPH